MQFYQSQAAYVTFDYTIPRGASVGVYARRNALPTHTQYHILEVLSGFKARTTRAAHVSFRLIFTSINYFSFQRTNNSFSFSAAIYEKTSDSLHGTRPLVFISLQ